MVDNHMKPGCIVALDSTGYSIHSESVGQVTTNGWEEAMSVCQQALDRQQNGKIFQYRL